MFGSPGKEGEMKGTSKGTLRNFPRMVKMKESTSERSGTMPYHAEDRGRPLFSECSWSEQVSTTKFTKT